MDSPYEQPIEDEPFGPFTKQELNHSTSQSILDYRLVRWFGYIATAAGFWCVIAPIILIISIIGWFYQLFVRLFDCLQKRCVQCRFFDQLPDQPTNRLKPIPLSALDSIWTHESSTNRSIITALLVLDGDLSIDQLREIVDQRIIQAPGMEKLRYSINQSSKQWEAVPNFDLCDHVYQWPRWKYGITDIDNRTINQTVRSPSASKNSRLDDHVHEALESLVSSIINKPIQRPVSQSTTRSSSTSSNQPASLWSFSLLPRCGGGCAIIFRAHHSLADGVLLSGVLLKALMDPPPVNPSINQATDQSNNLSGARQPVKHVSQTFHRIKHFISLAFGALHACLTGPYHLMMISLIDDDVNTFHSHKVTTTKRVAWNNQAIDMTRIKRIRQYYGCSVNDVMMSVLLEAMHRTMINRSNKRSIKQSNNQVNQQKHLHLIVPINIRGILSSDPNNQSNNQSNTQLGNLFAVLLLKAGLYPSLDQSDEKSIKQSTNNFPSPRRRLLSMTRLMNAVKRSSLPLTMYGAMALTVKLMPTLVARLVIDSFNDLATAILTNNRSPEDALYLGGNMLLYWCSWAPCRSQCGLSQTVLTYNGEMRASFVIDASCGVSSDELVKAFEHSFNRLEATLPNDQTTNHSRDQSIDQSIDQLNNQLTNQVDNQSQNQMNTEVVASATNSQNELYDYYTSHCQHETIGSSNNQSKNSISNNKSDVRDLDELLQGRCDLTVDVNEE